MCPTRKIFTQFSCRFSLEFLIPLLPILLLLEAFFTSVTGFPSFTSTTSLLTTSYAILHIFKSSILSRKILIFLPFCLIVWAIKEIVPWPISPKLRYPIWNNTSDITSCQSILRPCLSSFYIFFLIFSTIFNTTFLSYA